MSRAERAVLALLGLTGLFEVIGGPEDPEAAIMLDLGLTVVAPSFRIVINAKQQRSAQLQRCGRALLFERD